MLLQPNKHIRTVLGALLLAIFALCNTPTAFLHKLFADHHDFVAKEVRVTNSPELSVGGIDCHCNSLVVIAPYIASSGISIGNVPQVFIDHKPANIVAACVSQLFFFELRGPPSVA